MSEDCLEDDSSCSFTDLRSFFSTHVRSSIERQRFATRLLGFFLS